MFYYSHQSFQSNGLNGIATSGTHVYTYDSYVLKKFDGTTGNHLKSKQIESGNPQAVYWGGLAANNCDEILLADINKVNHYDTAFNLVNSYPMPDTIYDIRLREDGTVFVCGNNFIKTFNLNFANCLTITHSINQPITCSATGSASISVNGGTPPYNIVWNSTPAQTGNTAINLNSGMTYVATINDNNSCAHNINTDTVFILSPLTFTLTANVTPPLCNVLNDGSILINSVGATSPVFYNWSNGQNGVELNSLQNISLGTYSVEVTDSRSCKAHLVFDLKNPTGLMSNSFKPVNVFTPNQDSINDFFFPLNIEGLGVTNFNLIFDYYQLTIYDRWGKLVFETTDIQNYWDGKENTEGTYFWVLTISSECNSEGKKTLKGFVQLLR